MDAMKHIVEVIVDATPLMISWGNVGLNRRFEISGDGCNNQKVGACSTAVEEIDIGLRRG